MNQILIRTLGKTPWVTINGKDVSDSQLGIEYIEKELEKSLNEHLTPEQAAIARAFQVTLDDRFAWCLAIDRLVYGPGKVCNERGRAIS